MYLIDVWLAENEKNKHDVVYQSDQGAWSPQKECFHAYIIHRHGPMDFCNKKNKRGSFATHIGNHSKEMLIQYLLLLSFGGGG